MAKLREFSENEIKFAQLIGKFYLEKNQGDYDKTVKEIEGLNILDFKVILDHCCKCKNCMSYLEITTSRPGRWIGPRGKNIENIEAFLAKEGYSNICIKLKEENSVTDIFLPEPPIVHEDEEWYSDVDDDPFGEDSGSGFGPDLDYENPEDYDPYWNYAGYDLVPPEFDK